MVFIYLGKKKVRGSFPHMEYPSIPPSHDLYRVLLSLVQHNSSDYCSLILLSTLLASLIVNPFWRMLTINRVRSLLFFCMLLRRWHASERSEGVAIKLWRFCQVILGGPAAIRHVRVRCVLHIRRMYVYALNPPPLF